MENIETLVYLHREACRRAFIALVMIVIHVGIILMNYCDEVMNYTNYSIQHIDGVKITYVKSYHV